MKLKGQECDNKNEDITICAGSGVARLFGVREEKLP